MTSPLTVLKKMNMATLSEKIKFYMWEETRFRIIAERIRTSITPPRSKATIYIRLLGIRPPQEATILEQLIKDLPTDPVIFTVIAGTTPQEFHVSSRTK
jgi:hypothetical protein